LEQFLKSKHEATYVVEKLNSRFPKSYASFKIGIPSNLLKYIYNAEFWPTNTLVSKYFPTRPQTSYNKPRPVSLNSERSGATVPA